VGLHNRVLIANRGEIAIRIAKAATGLGINSVAVYAPADALSLHAHCATESRELPHNDPIRAYLDIDALLRIAEETGCDCVHPGYGFLAENAEFAARCEAAGLAFIGPAPTVLALFGDKVRARELAESLDIPVVPGTDALQSADAAREFAAAAGYPLMLKATAGGGGRGMRLVEDPAGLPQAFERCQSEAQAAFGNAGVFAEKLVQRPRHIEVQILADSHNNTLHLGERDCSIQLRNQKVIEIAPAPNLQPQLRDRILADAIRLVTAAGYTNVGTVEFLVSPESEEHYFIECNPRIQVEHTVTEQITGIDLVEAQFHVAAGAKLQALGLPEQSAVSTRGYSLQARVVAQGGGTITAYKEPSGAGIRVDASGHLGYSPPPQYDPLLAKLVCSVGATGTFDSLLQRALHALGEFHIAGIDTNLAQLAAILAHAEVRQGNARTTLLDEHTELTVTTAAAPTGTLALLQQRAATVVNPAASNAPRTTRAHVDLAVDPGATAVESPMSGSVLKVLTNLGAEITVGEPLFIISTMKMETEVTAPCSGQISALQALAEGAEVGAGQILAAITPSADDARRDAANKDINDTWEPMLERVEQLRRLAHERLAQGSQDPGVVRQRARGKLTCRERIDLLLDAHSFREVGSITGFASYDDAGEVSAFTPANHVGGWGKIAGNTAIVCADDFTSRGGHSDGAIGEKSRYLDELSLKLQVPSIRLLDGSSGGGSVAQMVPKQDNAGTGTAKESRGAIKAGRPRVSGGGGSFLAAHLGTDMYTEQLATVPVVNVLLGSVVGIGAAKAVLGHFSVMVRDVAQLFVAGPPVVSHAMGYDITKEELGGWHIHCTNGSVDNLAETEEDALALTRRFLSYLPQSAFEAPPVIAADPSDPPDRREEELSTLIPRKRTSTFDMRKAIRLLADRGSFFEIGPLWGTDQITGFVRFNGHPLGVIASDSRHDNGGALTADGCDKLRRHLDLCDVFHIPVLNLVDNPGFAVGLEHEINGTIRKGGEWMVAFSQLSVPFFTVVMRRSFGVGGNNFATPQAQRSVRVAWPAADVGGIPPEGGIEAAYKRQLAEADDPTALRAEIEARIESARGPVGPLNKFQMEEMIDPRDTRRLICEWVENAYRFVTQPARLAPRALQFRP
jgi:acetyl/propionyl-CoA carboxylase alpha subunit/acetyl-CoA carboxylase carboxyltransferase component